MVEATFLQPMAGSSSVRLLAGYLHNTVAKKPNSADHIHFLMYCETSALAEVAFSEPF